MASPVKNLFVCPGCYRYMLLSSCGFTYGIEQYTWEEKKTQIFVHARNKWDFCIPNIVPVTFIWPVLMNASKNIILMENNIEEVHCYSSLQRSVLFLNPK